MEKDRGNPTVLLAACGIGLGHTGRLLPIGRELSKRGFNVVFSTYGDSVRYAVKQGFLTYGEEELSYGLKEDGSLSLKETFRNAPRTIRAFLSQLSSELSVVRKHGPKVIVSDSRLSTLIASKILGVRSVLIMHEFRVILPLDENKLPGLGIVKRIVERIALETFGLGWDLADTVLVTDFPPPFTLCKDSVVVPEFLRHKVQFAGTVSQPRLDLDKDEALSMLGVDSGRPLIYFGLSGLPWERRSMLPRMIGAAKAVRSSGFNVLISKGEPGEAKTEKTDGLIVYDWLPDRRLAYQAADVFVSVGGQTSIGEAIRYALPTIVVPTPNHTEHDQIADSITEMGLGLKIKFSELTPERMRKAVLTLLGDRYDQRALAAAKLANEFQTVDYVASAVERLARAV